MIGDPLSIGEGACDRPTIGVVGAGRMGLAVAAALGRNGFRVSVASRVPRTLEPRLASLDAGLQGGSWRDVASSAEVVFLALTWDATSELRSIEPQLRGKVVLTCSNAETGGGLAIADGCSATETIAAALPRSQVVGALHHLYAEILERSARFDGGLPNGLYCGDDAMAKSTAAWLIASLGLDPVDCGPLRNARLLEATAELMVHLVRVRGLGPTGVALRLMAGRESRAAIRSDRTVSSAGTGTLRG